MAASSTSAARTYLRRIWAARHFWWHLARSDLRAKFRRSSLGLLWGVIHPLVLTTLLTAVMGAVFGAAPKQYGAFVLSGVIVWDLIVGAAMMGCQSLTVAGPYIKQFNQPIAIYALRHALVALAMFLLAFVSLVVWVAIWRPHNFGLATLALLPAIVVYFFIAWPLALITGFANARFRDFAQLLTIGLQLAWYSSPIFIQPNVFRSSALRSWLAMNPVHHLLNLVRAPMLNGTLPALDDYLVSLGAAGALLAGAALLISRAERTLIFML